MLFLKSMYKVSYLLEQVIKNNLLLDYSAMFTVCNTVSCDHGEMNHFAKIHHIVGPIDKKVYLSSLIFVITFNAPSRQR